VEIGKIHRIMGEMLSWAFSMSEVRCKKKISFFKDSLEAAT